MYDNKTINEIFAFGGIKVKRLLVFVSIAIAMLYQLGCSLDEEQTQSEKPITNDSTSVLNAPRFVGDVVLENMYLERNFLSA